MDDSPIKGFCEIAWICPVCDWVISDIERKYIKIDIDCPGCGTRKLSEFT